MAKVTGPLFSISASGKIADSMVHFGWKGVNVVRQWLKPANPKKPAQGDTRIMLGGLGRACGKVLPTGNFAATLIDLDVIPGGQTKQSYLVKYIRDHYIYDSTAYAAELATLTALATAYTAFSNGAGTLAIVDFDLDYADIAPFDKALGLFLIAKTAQVLGFTGTPYTTNITAWVAADVNGMINDFTNPV